VIRLVGQSSTTPRIAIVGAGWGGITAAVKLKQAGVETFTVFERNPRVGGCWFANDYPGLGVDVPFHLYTFSFKPVYRHWRRTHPLRDEILEYTESAVEDWDLAPHLRLSTAVVRATWDDAAHEYLVETDDGRVEPFDVVISAVGIFNTPRFPSWPGLESFRGPTFHTSRWEHQHDLAGKRVAVVGTGATAIQLVPSIAPTVGKLYVFQREPTWAIPRGDRDLSDDEIAELSRIRLQKWRRFRTFVRSERMVCRMRNVRTKKTKQQVQAEAYMEDVLGARPELKAAVTPTTAWAAKRPLMDGGFYEALTLENVELVRSPIARVTPGSVVVEDGTDYEIDVLVFATGFTVSDFLAPLGIVGRDGRTIREFWAGEPSAFLGIVVPNFPNFFMLYGPNTNGGGSVPVQLETQAKFAVRAIRRMQRTGASRIEVRPRAHTLWDRYVQRRNEGQVYFAAANYYKAATGKVVTEWPGTCTGYRMLAWLFGPIALRASTRRPVAHR
jgi:cation diffusion facilitator CzcD-associated flavoprotein CzcO